MSATLYVIRYTYPGMTNGEPVGDVYVERVHDEVFSYTKDPAKATHFLKPQADRLFHKWVDNGAEIVPLKEAKVLPRRSKGGSPR